MDFQKRTETKYNHFPIVGRNLVLIGVDKTISNEEASIFIDTPLMIYEGELMSKIMQLDVNYRNVIMSALEEWRSSDQKVNSFNGYYWDVLLDFIFCIYGLSLSKLSNTLKSIKKYDREYYSINNICCGQAFL